MSQQTVFWQILDRIIQEAGKDSIFILKSSETL